MNQRLPINLKLVEKIRICDRVEGDSAIGKKQKCSGNWHGGREEDQVFRTDINWNQRGHFQVKLMEEGSLTANWPCSEHDSLCVCVLGWGCVYEEVGVVQFNC